MAIANTQSNKHGLCHWYTGSHPHNCMCLVSGSCWRLLEYTCRDLISSSVGRLFLQKRVMFKTVVLVWSVLTALLQATPELCVLVASASGRQHLSSASTGLLQVPRARTMIGRQSLAVAGLSLWNSLPAALRRLQMTLNTFKWQLKAYLFHIWCANEQKEHPPPPGTVVAFFRDSGAGHKTVDLFPRSLKCGTSDSWYCTAGQP